MDRFLLTILSDGILNVNALLAGYNIGYHILLRIL